MSLYTHNIEGALASKIGRDGASDNFLKPFEPSLFESLHLLKKQYESGELPHYTLPFVRKDLSLVEAIADRYRDEFCDVVVLGTGGSSLGGKMLTALRESETPRLHFMDNVDPHSFQRLFKKVKTCTTGFIVISKSGNTVETLAQFMICLEHWKNHTCEHSLRDHFFVITEDKDSPIHRLADLYSIPTFDHDPKLGGRFSVLSLVGLLPFMIAGGNPIAVREGAGETLKKIISEEKVADIAPVVGAALHVSLNLPMSIMLPYHDRLALFSKWWRQLWAESLGKKGRGSTPIDALGTVDQHSQLQLYLDGPHDKFFTLMGTRKVDEKLSFPLDLVHKAGAEYLEGRSMGALLVAEQEATYKTLVSAGRPTRLIEIDDVSPHALGALVMHFKLETIFAASLLRVNPYDQPAVEAGKIMAQEILSGQHD